MKTSTPSIPEIPKRARSARSPAARMRSLTVLTAILLSLAHAPRVHAVLIVTSGTGQIGNGVSLSIVSNQVQNEDHGFTVGEKVHSPGGDPDLWFRAASTRRLLSDADAG